MKIVVSQLHIDAGSPVDTNKCPIALSLRDMGFIIHVSRNKVSLTKEYELPLSARRFLVDFDDGKNVQPFSFHLTNHWEPTYVELTEKLTDLITLNCEPVCP